MIFHSEGNNKNWWMRVWNGSSRLRGPSRRCAVRKRFPINHLCILTRITWKLQVVHGHSAYRTTALLLGTFLVWLRVAWEIWLESYNPRHASVISDTTLCAYTASHFIHPYLVCNYAWQENSCSLQLFYTPNIGFTANDASFYKNTIG